MSTIFLHLKYPGGRETVTCPLKSKDDAENLVTLLADFRGQVSSFTIKPRNEQREEWIARLIGAPHESWSPDDP